MRTPVKSERKSDFLFVGNHLALDFLNTRPVQNGAPVELLPDFAALLQWFQAANLLRPRDRMRHLRHWGRSDRARRTLEAAWDLRNRLRKDVLAWERGAALNRASIAELNRLLTAYPMRTRLRSAQNALSKELWFEPKQPEELLAPLAHSAAALFTEADRFRVRKCGQCVLHFYDTSKKGTRRWCSMQLCGNRLKVAAYAARRRTP
jgi:predicted RNA-binding Zn ribbon-like protein